jgi:hypothetical protein
MSTNYDPVEDINTLHHFITEVLGYHPQMDVIGDAIQRLKDIVDDPKLSKVGKEFQPEIISFVNTPHELDQRIIGVKIKDDPKVPMVFQIDWLRSRLLISKE